MDNYKIDENYFLNIYDDNNNNLVITKELLFNIKNHIFFQPYNKNFSEKITDLNSSLSIISFKFCNIPVEIFDSPINCNFIKMEKEILVFSNVHLKLILNKIQYDNPYYLENEQKFILNEEKINSLEHHQLAIINREEKVRDLIEQYYNELNILYSENFKLGISTYEFISVNFNKYFLIKGNLKNKFYYFQTLERTIVEDKINDFLKNDNENLLGFCGPYGIGKSITSLFIQKKLYFNKKISAYINLKYYYNKNIEYKEKAITFIKECYFLVDNSEDLFNIYESITLIEINIWKMITILMKYLNKKNKKDCFLIIDQYKKKYDIEKNLKNLIKNFKVIIFSSIKFNTKYKSNNF